MADMEHKDLKTWIVEKLLSGRFIFTVIAAGVFAYMAVTSKLPVDKVTEILLIVLWAYFNKPNNGAKPQGGV